jgi:hypothetical protein
VIIAKELSFETAIFSAYDYNKKTKTAKEAI